MDVPEAPRRSAFHKVARPPTKRAALGRGVKERIKAWLNEQGLPYRWVSTNTGLSLNTVKWIFQEANTWKTAGPYAKTIRALLIIPGLPADIVTDLRALLFMSGMERLPAAGTTPV